MSGKLFALILVLWAFQETRPSAQVAPSSASTDSATPPAYKTSFDCSKAKDYSLEQAICRSEELAKLDLELAEAYGKRWAAVDATQKIQLVESQRNWLTIRNDYDANPYHDDYAGLLSDLADFYRSRIVALESDDSKLLKAELPKEYAVLKAIAPKGFDHIHIQRTHLTCEDPCEKKFALYRTLAIANHDNGEPGRDTGTSYEAIEKGLASEGWTLCRSDDDTRTDYFHKGDKMIALGNSGSMGVGLSTSLSITTSQPLPEKVAAPNGPPDTDTSSWISYSDLGFKVQYPSRWEMKDKSGSGRELFEFDGTSCGNGFDVSIFPKMMADPRSTVEIAPNCVESPYRVSGFSSYACLAKGESLVRTPTLYIESIEFDSTYDHLSVHFKNQANVIENAQHIRLNELYEKILNTIEVK